MNSTQLVLISYSSTFGSHGPLPLLHWNGMCKGASSLPLCIIGNLQVLTYLDRLMSAVGPNYE